MKLAILTPGFMPVPAVKGGAVEQLIEDIIVANESSHKYDIDLYTIDEVVNGFRNKNIISVFRSFYCT